MKDVTLFEDVSRITINSGNFAALRSWSPGAYYALIKSKMSAKLCIKIHSISLLLLINHESYDYFEQP